jgi:hypothetical protein
VLKTIYCYLALYLGHWLGFVAYPFSFNFGGLLCSYILCRAAVEKWSRIRHDLVVLASTILLLCWLRSHAGDARAEPPSLVQPTSASWMWCWSRTLATRLRSHSLVRGEVELEGVIATWSGILYLFIASTDVDAALRGSSWYTSELKVKFCSGSPFAWTEHPST